MASEFRFLMLGAMYENGGNTTHRFLDGHPELFVYPFESQVGTCHVHDLFASTFPVKYRWPEFRLDATPLEDYRAIIDEEGKVRARTPNVSKFRHVSFKMDDEERAKIYQQYVARTGRSRANNVAAFFQATFDAWKDYNRSGNEKMHVGYSPIITVDAAKILGDMPNAHFLHVVRNPWSAYADTKKRPVPLALDGYMLGWTLNQHFALLVKERFPDRMHIVRTEDVMRDPQKTLGALCEKMGLSNSPTLGKVTWNGTELEEVYPWGTIRKASTEANRATAAELSEGEQASIREQTWQYLETFDYKNFLKR